MVNSKFSPMMFQSLGRDSVGWDLIAAAAFTVPSAVSIPRSGFCGVGREGGRREARGEGRGFNPSVGILWGGTL